MKKAFVIFTLVFSQLLFILNGPSALAQTNPAYSAPSSDSTFFPHYTESEREKLKILFNEDETIPPMENAIDLLMALEEMKNFPMFKQDTKEVTALMGAYPIGNVTINCGKGFCDSLKNKFIKTINGEKMVFFPVHPLNTDPNVPGYEIVKGSTNNNVGTITLRNLASRSKMVVEPGISPFGLKIGTNYILPNVYQPNKTDTFTETHLTIARTKHIDHTDKLIGKDPNLVFLREIAAFRLNDHKRGGFVIREMTPLNDGNIYLPAFSIPYVGPQIAAANGENFHKFWEKHYAENLGKSKAKLLLRYGLQMQTPNSQNMLVKLDRNLKPTGGIVFRDNGDTEFVRPVINALEPKSNWYKNDENLLKILGEKREEFIKEYIFAHNANSTWRFDEAPGKLSIPIEVVKTWNKKQSEAYLQHINSELGTSIEPLASAMDPAIAEYKKLITDPNHASNFGKNEELQYILPVFTYLTSPEGQIKLAQYRKGLMAKEKERKKKEKWGIEKGCGQDFH